MMVGVLLVGGGSAWATTGHEFAGQLGGLGGGDGEFGEFDGSGPSGIGLVAGTGEVVTADDGQSARRVQRFGADGVFGSRFAVDSLYNTLGAVAVDAAGAVYGAANRDPGIGAVGKYSADG